jgi:stage II sporulation protein D
VRGKAPAFSLLFSFTVLILASIGAVPACGQDLQAGDEYLRKGMYLEAIGAYQEGADQSRDRETAARSLLRIGDIYAIFLNEPDPALEKYRVVRERYADTSSGANALFNSGMLLFEKNRFTDALELFRQYVSRYPASDRRMTADFMIEACLNPPAAPAKEEKAPEVLPADPPIRVLIEEGAAKIVIRSAAPIFLKDKEERKNLHTFREGVDHPVFPSGGGIASGGVRFTENPVVLVPSGTAPVAVNGIEYRGSILLSVSGDRLNGINVLGLEEYLCGVLPKEMSWSWPPEALKAQAVAARSYALYQKSRSGEKEYDVYGTTSSQVYGGVPVEKEQTNRAVAETRGKVLFYNGQLVLAYFHSNSGGMTEDAKEVWTAEVPYLKGVRDDFSGIGPSYEWVAKVSLEEITEALKRGGEKLGTIRRLEPLEKSPSGRIRKIRIVYPGGEKVLTGNNFRVKSLPREIKSTLFTLESEGKTVHFDGKGYGHGVGMSQWGARGMAEKGRTYEEILKYYYSGVALGTLGVPAPPSGGS